MCGFIMACVFVAGGYLFISGANYINGGNHTIDIPKIDPEFDFSTPPIDPELPPETPPENPEVDPSNPPVNPENPDVPGGSGDDGSGSGESGGGGGSGDSEGNGSGSGSGDNDGNNDGSGGGGGGGGGGGDADIDPRAWFRIKDSKGGLIYLRTDSYGDYTGKGEHGFKADEKYYLEEDDYVNPLNYFSICLKGSGISKETAEIVLISEKSELLPYYPFKRNNSDAGNLQYRIEYYPYEYSYQTISSIKKLAEIDSSYIEQERIYREYVYTQYTDIDLDLKQFLLEKGESANISAQDVDIVEKIAFFIQTSAYYDMDWGYTNYPSDKDMVRYFFEIKEGVCRHYAATATMMFRAYGIPARYTIGYAINPPEDEWFDYYDAGHAWVEIYIDGLGWVKVEVTGSDNIPDDEGSLDGGGESGEINPDGSGSGDGSGEGGNGSGSGDGEDDSDDPDDPALPALTIKITTKGGEKTYDGEPLTAGYDLSGDALDTNRYEIRVVSQTSEINVGSYANDIKIQVFDKIKNTVAKNVKITYEYNKLVIKPKQLIISTGSKTASIEETSVLWCKEYNANGLLSTDSVESIEFSKQEGVGFTENNVESIKIVNSLGEDANRNYSIEVDPGYLWIKG